MIRNTPPPASPSAEDAALAVNVQGQLSQKEIEQTAQDPKAQGKENAKKAEEKNANEQRVTKEDKAKAELFKKDQLLTEQVQFDQVVAVALKDGLPVSEQAGGALHAFEALAANIDINETPPDAAQLRPAFDTGLTALSIKAVLPEMSPRTQILQTATTLLKGDLGRLSPEQAKRIEHVKTLMKMMDQQYAKKNELTEYAQLRTQQLSTELQEKLKVIVPKVGELYKSYMQLKAPKAKKSTELEAEDIPEIPSPQLVAMEKVAQEMLPLVKHWQATAVEEWSAVFPGWQPVSRRNGSAPGVDEGTAARGDEVADENETPPNTPPDTPPSGGWLSGSGQAPGTGGVSVQMMHMLRYLDVDALLIIVMMNATKVEEDMLRDKLAEMAAVTAQKAAMRETKTKMKREEARLESQMREEYNMLRAAGKIAADKTFEDYKSWRQCQWASPETNPETGEMTWPPAQLTLPSPPVDIPDWLAMTNEEAAAAQEADAASGVTGSMSDQFGLPQPVLKSLEAIYNALPDPKAASFEEFLELDLFMHRPPHNLDEVQENLQMAMDRLNQEKEASQSAQVNPVTAAMLGPNGEIAKTLTEIMELAMILGQDPNNDSLKTQLGAAQNKLATLMLDGFESQVVKDLYVELVGNIQKKFLDGLAEMQEQVDGFKNKGPGGGGFDEGSRFGMDQAGGGDQSWGSFDEAVGDMQWDPEDIFSDTFGWRSQADYESNEESGWGGYGEGTSSVRGYTWDGNGYKGTGNYHDYDDATTAGTFFFTDDDAKSGAKYIQGFLEKYGVSIGSENNMDEIYSDLAGMLAGVTDIVAGLQPGGTYCPDKITPTQGEGVITSGDWERMADQCQDYLDDMDDPDSAYSQWLNSKDYDGSQAAAAAEQKQEDQEEAAEKAARAARNSAGDDSHNDSPLDQQGNLAMFETFIQEVDDKLQNLSELSEMDMMKIQIMMDRRSKFIEALSNLIKKVDQVNDTITGNLK